MSKDKRRAHYGIDEISYCVECGKAVRMPYKFCDEICLDKNRRKQKRPSRALTG